MEIFTKEHEIVRKKYATNEQANYWLNTISSTKIEPNLVSFLENLPYFFLATSNKTGVSNINFKGTNSGKLIKVIDEKRLIYPDYKGNGILHGVGDIFSNDNVGLLCIDFSKDFRVKINGRAKIIDDQNELIKYFDIFDTYDISRIIEITVEYIIPNCSNQISIVRESI